jgi:ribosomal protein L20A (L18A)
MSSRNGVTREDIRIILLSAVKEISSVAEIRVF